MDEVTADTVDEVMKRMGPAVYLLIAVVVLALLYYVFVFKRKFNEEQEQFGSSSD